MALHHQRRVGRIPVTNDDGPSNATYGVGGIEQLGTDTPTLLHRHALQLHQQVHVPVGPLGRPNTHVLRRTR